SRGDHEVGHEAPDEHEERPRPELAPRRDRRQREERDDRGADDHAREDVPPRQVAPEHDPHEGEPQDGAPLRRDAREPPGREGATAAVQAHPSSPPVTGSVPVSSSATSFDSPCPRSESPGKTASTYVWPSSSVVAARSVYA